MDMDDALDQIFQVLKPGGKGLVVVQSYYFKGMELPLREIYREIAATKGFSSEIAYREKVKGHMARVNTKSHKYKRKKVYFEDFVLIEKRSSASQIGEL